MGKDVFPVDDRRGTQSQFRAASGPAHHRDAAHRHLCRHADSYLLHRLHGARRRLLPFLQLPQPLHVFMLTLVLAANIVVMFVGWEGVGLCSYLLIGFWFLKQSAISAGKKAFITTRIG